MDNELKQRWKQEISSVAGDGETGTTAHPGGDIKHGGSVQILRLLLVIVYFFSSCFSIVATQFIGAPLYWVNRDLYYAYMALTKQSFGIFVTTLTQWWAPTVIRISGDSSVAGQFGTTPDGLAECRFPDRLIMIANHQLYSDWLYLWWIAYTNSPRMHGHIYIILKESLKHVPIIGWGMRFYGFIFMSRKMSTDQPRLAHRLGQLKERHSGPLSGSSGFDPMWLLLFPEGTNASKNTRVKSVQWAEKQGIKDMEHVLLPRSTGTFFCLNEIKGTVDYVYDCTLAYGGVGRGEYGQDLYTLRSMYLQGRPPPSVNMYWRRFAISDMPLDDHDKFDLWLRERWSEKDTIMDYFITKGRFPPSKSMAINGTRTGDKTADGYVETEAKLAHWWEVGNIFIVLAAVALLADLGARAWNAVLYGRQF